MENQTIADAAALGVCSRLRGIINQQNTLPQEVFSARIKRTLFASSDAIISLDGLFNIRLTLNTFGGDAAYIFNATEYGGKQRPLSRFIRLSASTSEEQFARTCLIGGDHPAWFAGVDRFYIAPDYGAWAIVCEKENDILVFGSEATKEEIGLHATPEYLFDLETELSLSRRERIFPFSDLTTRWEDELRRNYL